MAARKENNGRKFPYHLPRIEIMNFHSDDRTSVCILFLRSIDEGSLCVVAEQETLVGGSSVGLVGLVVKGEMIRAINNR